MRIFFKLLSAGVLMSALCMSCGGNGSEPPPEEPIVLTDPSKYDGYYMNGERKVEFTIVDGISYIVFKTDDSQAVTDKIVALGGEIPRISPLRMTGLANPDGYLLNCSWTEATAGYDDVSEIPEVIYATPILRGTTPEENYAVSSFFSVKLKSGKDLVKLKKISEDNNLLFLGKDNDNERYWLACTKESTGNTAQITNWLYEMDLFESVYPSILQRFVPAVNTKL